MVFWCYSSPRDAIVFIDEVVKLERCKILVEVMYVMLVMRDTHARDV